jgi:hypothetical protein
MAGFQDGIQLAVNACMFAFGPLTDPHRQTGSIGWRQGLGAGTQRLHSTASHSTA